MDNTLVSARVSKAKKERAGSVLASIGATTSDLINSALDYVISTKELPVAQSPRKSGAGSFAAFRRKSTLDIPWDSVISTMATSDPEAEKQLANGDYKGLMKAGRLRDYESLA